MNNYELGKLLFLIMVMGIWTFLIRKKIGKINMDKRNIKQISGWVFLISLVVGIYAMIAQNNILLIIAIVAGIVSGIFFLPHYIHKT